MKGKVSCLAARLLITADLKEEAEEYGHPFDQKEVDRLLVDGRYDLATDLTLILESDGWYLEEYQEDAFFREWSKSISEARNLAHRLKEVYKLAA